MATDPNISYGPGGPALQAPPMGPGNFGPSNPPVNNPPPINPPPMPTPPPTTPPPTNLPPSVTPPGPGILSSTNANNILSANSNSLDQIVNQPDPYEEYLLNKRNSLMNPSDKPGTEEKNAAAAGAREEAATQAKYVFRLCGCFFTSTGSSSVFFFSTWLV